MLGFYLKKSNDLCILMLTLSSAFKNFKHKLKKYLLLKYKVYLNISKIK